MPTERQPKPKRVTVSVIERDDDDPQEPYRIMDDLVGKYHPDLAEAHIAIAWNYSWSEDKDGHVRLGQCSKASDLNRELHSYDFVISLNYDAWNNTLGDHQRVALMDHELCHAAPLLDAKSGEQVQDENGRPCWRIRKHDIEEFVPVVHRHGTWKADIEAFVGNAMIGKSQPLFPAEPDDERLSVTLEHAGKSVTVTPQDLDRVADATTRRKRGKPSIVVGKDLTGMAPAEIEKEIMGCFDKQKGNA